MTTDDRIRSAYDRKRALYIATLRALAGNLATEANAIEGNGFKPLGYWNGHIRELEDALRPNVSP